MRYKVGSKNPGSKFIQVEIELDNLSREATEFFLPRWRPGRYELGNFAKNIKSFSASSGSKPLNFKKTGLHSWRIEHPEEQSITINYEFYANQYDAGNSYTDNEQLYVNPINCLMYTKEERNSPCILKIETHHRTIAIALPSNGDKQFQANGFDELADSPFIASDTLQHSIYQVNETKFHLWFQGECAPEWDKIKNDFHRFSAHQIKIFGSSPFNEYHFLFHLLPVKAYHGVEHLSSTVISLGPGYELMKPSLYNEFLGVSSHELLHSWNVKTIRPSDWLPYDYQYETPSILGYLAEGFTTYLGDLHLIQSGVFTWEQYQKELHKLLDRHSYNYGRFNYSVSESSFDTWLDGYQKGIPGRKTSIYAEGALLALCLDCKILVANDGKKSLNNLLANLYQRYAIKGTGITEKHIIATLLELGVNDAEDFFRSHYHHAIDLYETLKKLFSNLGLQLERRNNSNALASQYGLYSDKNGKILLLAPESPAAICGLQQDDQVIAINGITINESCNDWANYFFEKKEPTLTLIVNKDNKTQEIKIHSSEKVFFENYRINQKKDKTELEKRLFQAWLHQ